MKIKDQKAAAENLEILRKELLAELGSLRGQFRDIVNHYQSELEADLVKCINLLSLPHESEGKSDLAGAKKLFALAKRIRELKIKTDQGRLKDIRRIDKLVSKISSELVEK
ncbi:hypothetical protein JW992_09320 [candidate division KSB1 bacterium]|nr:hypothetical protein [candidate division KSB1 bacterium]